MQLPGRGLSEDWLKPDGSVRVREMLGEDTAIVRLRLPLDESARGR